MLSINKYFAPLTFLSSVKEHVPFLMVAKHALIMGFTFLSHYHWDEQFDTALL